jgi:AcrR family transcriptional regulator
MLSTVRDEEKLDPRVKRTRSLLERAFMEAILEKGFQAVSVQDITQKAGVNRATFYAHFEDKYALLDHSIRQGFRQELDKRMLDACKYSPENLKLLIVAVCEFVTNINSHCTPPQAQFESLVETQIKNQLQELLENWIERADSRVDPETAATAASWAIYGLSLQWSHDKSKKHPSAEKFAEQVLPLVAANLGLGKRT